jgi:hypothetical protein
MQNAIMSFRQDQIEQLKNNGYLTITGDNQLFDIIADRARTFKLNIPRSQYHNTPVTMMAVEEAFDWDGGAPSDIARHRVLVFDTAQVKNPKYLHNYLKRKVDC